MKKKAFIISLTLILLLSMSSFAFADEKFPPVGKPFSITPTVLSE